MTREQLLAPVVRWTAAKKAGLLDGVKAGIICIDDLVKAHRVSADEVMQWAVAYQKRGLPGLKALSRREAA